MTEALAFANQFVPLFAEIAAKAADDRKSLQEKIDALKTQHEQIDKEIEGLEQHIASIDEDVAVGFNHAARIAGVRVTVVSRKREEDARAHKTPTKQLSEKDVNKLLDVIPDGEDDALTIGKITKALDAPDSAPVAAAIKRLLKERAITSVGERRAKRYFKPGKKLAQKSKQ